jgi:hypothetical protein
VTARRLLAILPLLLAHPAHALVIVDIDRDTPQPAYAAYVSFYWVHADMSAPSATSLGTGPSGLAWFEQPGAQHIDAFVGFGVFFHVPVYDVTIYGRQVTRCQSDDGTAYIDNVAWFAFDANGIAMRSGGEAAHGCSHMFPVPVDVASLASFVIGTADGSATTQFERLTFGVNAAAVLEPAALSTCAMGLVVLLLARVRGWPSLSSRNCSRAPRARWRRRLSSSHACRCRDRNNRATP